MFPLISSLLLAAATSIYAFGCIDAIAQLVGGSTLHYLTIGGLFMLAMGRGALRANRAPIGWGLGLFMLALGIVPPLLAPWVAPVLGENTFGFSWAGGLALAWLLLRVPAMALGSHLTARIDAAAPAAWNAVGIGATLGIFLVTSAGLGSLGFVVATIFLVACCGISFPAPSRRRLTAPHAKPRELVPLAMFSLALTVGLLWLLPLLELFDGSSTTQDSRRLLTLATIMLAGSWAVGSAISMSRWAGPFTSVIGLLFAFGWTRIPQQLDRLSDPNIFSLMTGNQVIGGLFGLEGRLGEDHWLYAPFLAILIAALALISGGACIRSGAGMRHRGEGEMISPIGPSAAILQAVGVGLLMAAFLPSLVGYFGLLAFCLALAGTCVCIWQCQIDVKPSTRLFAISMLTVVAAICIRFPSQIKTGVPFFDNYTYEVVEQLRSPLAITRIVRRNSASSQGRIILANGRNFSHLEGVEASQRSREFLLAKALGSSDNNRVMLIGEPNGEHLRMLPADTDITVVCDPPQLARLAIAKLPSWAGKTNAKVVATPATGTGRYGCVFVNTAELWDNGGRWLTSSSLATARRKVAPGGVLAITMDLGASTPDLIQALNDTLARLNGVVQLWLVPGEWNKPSLLFTVRENGELRVPSPFLQAALSSNGLPLTSVKDFACLEINLKASALDGWVGVMSSPIAPITAGLAHTEHRHHDMNKLAVLRAGKSTSYLMQNAGRADCSLLPFLNAHLNSQLWDVYDNLPGYTQADRIDIDRSCLDALLSASRDHPTSDLLKQIWRDLGRLLIDKREADWCWEYYRELTSPEGLGWEDQELLWVVGNAALEMLEAEIGLDYAQHCLRLDPLFTNALILKGMCLSQLERWAHAAGALRKAAQQLTTPSLELLQAWTTAALKSTADIDLGEIYVLLARHYPDHEMDQKLLERLGLEPLKGH